MLTHKFHSLQGTTGDAAKTDQARSAAVHRRPSVAAPTFPYRTNPCFTPTVTAVMSHLVRSHPRRHVEQPRTFPGGRPRTPLPPEDTTRQLRGSRAPEPRQGRTTRSKVDIPPLVHRPEVVTPTVTPEEAILTTGRLKEDMGIVIRALRPRVMTPKTPLLVATTRASSSQSDQWAPALVGRFHRTVQALVARFLPTVRLSRCLHVR